MNKQLVQFIGLIVTSLGFLSIATAQSVQQQVCTSSDPEVCNKFYIAQTAEIEQRTKNYQVAECKTSQGDLASNKAIIASLCSGKDQETCYEGMGKQLSQSQRSQALKEEKDRLDGKAEKAEDKVSDLQKQIYDVQVEMQQKQKEAADKTSELQMKIKASATNMNKELRSLDKEQREDYNKLRGSLSENRKRLVEVTIDDKKKISSMYSACRKEIAEKQNQLEQLKAQQPRKKGVQDLLSSANGNATSKKQFDFKTYYASCTTDPSFKEEIENVITSNQANVKELQEDINEIQTQINELKTQNAQAKTDAQRAALEEQENLAQQLNNEYQNTVNMNMQYGQRLQQLNAQLAGKQAEMKTYKTEYQAMATTNSLKGGNNSPVGTLMATTYQTNLDTLRTAYGNFNRAYAEGAQSGCNTSDYQDLYNTIGNQGAQ